LDGRERLQTEMEIESFHVRTIKMFFVELQVVGMTTRRPPAINLLWRLANGSKKISSRCKNILEMPSSEVMSVIN
jgi:hypothetical protein